MRFYSSKYLGNPFGPLMGLSKHFAFGFNYPELFIWKAQIILLCGVFNLHHGGQI